MTTPAPASPGGIQARLASGELAGDWTLDPARSTAAFRSRSMWGLAPVRGVFRDVEGSGTISPAGEVTGRIDLASGSVDTGNTRRDTHLRSADFFLSEKYPMIIFALAGLAVSGDGLTASGTLTVRDRGNPVSFPVTAALAGDGEAVVDATLEVDRSQFGLTWSPMRLASVKNAVTIHAVFTRS